MNFAETFAVEKGDVICIAGAGGKTSLILHLAGELTDAGYKVLVSTTTRLAADEVSDRFDFLVRPDGEKALAPDIGELRNRVKDYDITLIEADGSARKPLKGWREDEPVIPDFATVTIGVLDISTLGSKPDAHRPELFYRLVGDAKRVELSTLAHIANSPEGLFRHSSHTKNILYLSKAEGRMIDALKLSKMTGLPVTAGSVRDGYIKRFGITAVIMAAGSSSRMGENKLLLKIDGKEIIRHMLESYPADLFDKTALVYSDPRVAALCTEGWLTLIRVEPGRDKCETIKPGTAACADSDGMMFFVADQPFMRPETVERITAEFYADESKIVIPVCKGRQRNPVIFPKSTYNELMELTGDKGGRDVIDRHPELAVYIEFEDEGQFADIDTREDYEKHIR